MGEVLHGGVGVALGGSPVPADPGARQASSQTAQPSGISSLNGGTIVGSGTVANQDEGKGASCLAELRMLEIIADGKPKTPFMSFGDTIRIEMLDAEGASVFGAIEQVIEPYAG